MDIFAENDIMADDLEIFEIIDVGFPRQIYQRFQYFHTFDEMAFFKRFRLKKETVLNLLVQIENRLEFPYNINNCVSPINQLLITLRFFATGNHLLSISDFGGMHVSTACRIVKRVSNAIAVLAQQYITLPTTDDAIMNNQRQFFDIASFPRVIGVIDGTHIKIQSPGGDDAEVWRNRKNYFSVNVQIVCNAKLEIMNLIARWPGSTHDMTIFNNSNLKLQFENANYGNSLLLGDSAYTLRHFLLTPLLNPVGVAQQRYNEAHIRTRNVIERCIGVWKRRFPICAYGSRLKVENTLTVIVATAVLHNLATAMGEEQPPLENEEHALDILIHEGNIPEIHNAGHEAAGGRGFGLRNILINQYFGILN